MAQGAVMAVLSGNPIGAMFSGLLGLLSSMTGQQRLIRNLIDRIKYFQTTFRGMQQRGMFGSQTQQRMVDSRAIWEQIGWVQPNEIPPLFDKVPPGTQLQVKEDLWPLGDRINSGWVNRGWRDAWRGNLRWPDRLFYGSTFAAPSGVPPDTLPPVGVNSLRRIDFPPAALARALDAQPQQYLGPRRLAGDEARIRRAAFEAGGGRVGQLWDRELSNQSEREGRRVRAWAGQGWIDKKVNQPIFEEGGRMDPPAYRGEVSATGYGPGNLEGKKGQRSFVRFGSHDPWASQNPEAANLFLDLTGASLGHIGSIFPWTKVPTASLYELAEHGIFDFSTLSAWEAT